MSPWLAHVLEVAVPLLATPLVVLLVQGIRYLSAKIGFTLTEKQQTQLRFALEQGVAAAAERYRGAAGNGTHKAQFALDQARSLAPEAMKKVQPEQQRVLVEATYARLRPSLPAPSTFSVHGDDIPIDVVHVGSDPAQRARLSERPTPLPPLRGPVGPGAKGGPTR